MIAKWDQLALLWAFISPVQQHVYRHEMEREKSWSAKQVQQNNWGRGRVYNNWPCDLKWARMKERIWRGAKDSETLEESMFWSPWWVPSIVEVGAPEGAKRSGVMFRDEMQDYGAAIVISNDKVWGMTITVSERGRAEHKFIGEEELKKLRVQEVGFICVYIEIARN